MSLAELLVVALVAIIFFDAKDLPLILKKIRQLQNFIYQAKQKVITQLNLDLTEPELKKEIISDSIDTDPELINFYLQKLVDLGYDYEGEYSVTAIKKYYQSLMQQRITQSTRSSNR